VLLNCRVYIISLWSGYRDGITSNPAFEKIAVILNCCSERLAPHCIFIRQLIMILLQEYICYAFASTIVNVSDWHFTARLLNDIRYGGAMGMRQQIRAWIHHKFSSSIFVELFIIYTVPHCQYIQCLTANIYSASLPNVCPITSNFQARRVTNTLISKYFAITRDQITLILTDWYNGLFQ